MYAYILKLLFGSPLRCSSSSLLSSGPTTMDSTDIYNVKLTYESGALFLEAVCMVPYNNYNNEISLHPDPKILDAKNRLNIKLKCMKTYDGQDFGWIEGCSEQRSIDLISYAFTSRINAAVYQKDGAKEYLIIVNGDPAGEEIKDFIGPKNTYCSLIDIVHQSNVPSARLKMEVTEQ